MDVTDRLKKVKIIKKLIKVDHVVVVEVRGQLGCDDAYCNLGMPMRIRGVWKWTRRKQNTLDGLLLLGSLISKSDIQSLTYICLFFCLVYKHISYSSNILIKIIEGKDSLHLILFHSSPYLHLLHSPIHINTI